MGRRSNYRLRLQTEAAEARAQSLSHMVSLELIAQQQAVVESLVDAGKDRQMQSTLMASFLSTYTPTDREKRAFGRD